MPAGFRRTGRLDLTLHFRLKAAAKQLRILKAQLQMLSVLTQHSFTECQIAVASRADDQSVSERLKQMCESGIVRMVLDGDQRRYAVNIPYLEQAFSCIEEYSAAG